MCAQHARAIRDAGRHVSGGPPTTCQHRVPRGQYATRRATHHLDDELVLPQVVAVLEDDAVQRRRLSGGHGSRGDGCSDALRDELAREGAHGGRRAAATARAAAACATAADAGTRGAGRNARSAAHRQCPQRLLPRRGGRVPCKGRDGQPCRVGRRRPVDVAAGVDREADHRRVFGRLEHVALACSRDTSINIDGHTRTHHACSSARALTPHHATPRHATPLPSCLTREDAAHADLGVQREHDGLRQGAELLERAVRCQGRVELRDLGRDRACVRGQWVVDTPAIRAITSTSR